MDLIGALIGMLPDAAPLRSQLPGALVQPMNDGGMGSLRFVTSGSDRMHHEAVAARCLDEDGVPLELSLNLDENGDLFELDIWKVDFSPVKHLPAPSQVQRA